MTIADRATIANMSPEFGATCAYFPVDDETLRYLRFTGRPEAHVALVEAYAKEQGLWHEPAGPPRYTETVDLDLGSVVASLAGPRRPQDRVPLTGARSAFRAALREAPPPGRGPAPVTIDGREHHLDHGSVVIAAITSCTNTANPSVMVAAALLAKKAVDRGLRTKPWVKTTLSLGSRVVTDYYDDAGLTPYLEELGFHLTGYGCMTCIGASGPLVHDVTRVIDEHGLNASAVASVPGRHGRRTRSARRRRRRPRARQARGLRHDRPHLAGRRHPAPQPRRAPPPPTRSGARRTQHLRLVSREPRGDDARHLRQSPPAQPPGR
jgi:aconitate hydratase